MRAGATWTLVAAAVLAVAACSGNPLPGDRGYPYNTTGMYELSMDTQGAVYAGPAELTTSPGGLVYGTVQVSGPEDVVGDFSGSIAGDTLTFESNYERGGGCSGLLSGSGIVVEGGGSVSGAAIADDTCTGALIEFTFTMTRQAE